jgi:FixJ family two-component response regulator
MPSQSFFKPIGDANGRSAVYVVDDDESIRRSLGGLLRSVGLQAETFSSLREFLDFARPDAPSCLILDVRLKGENGLTFLNVSNNSPRIPVLFMTGHGDIEMSVKAMKAGASDFFAKPFREQDMLDAVAHALARDTERLAAEKSLAVLRSAYDSLTEREREIVAYVVAGLLNKQIAAEMSLSEITVKVHRGHAMRKMAAKTVADLVRKAHTLGIAPARTRLVRSSGTWDAWAN